MVAGRLEKEKIIVGLFRHSGRYLYSTVEPCLCRKTLIFTSQREKTYFVVQLFRPFAKEVSVQSYVLLLDREGGGGTGEC